MDYLYLAFGMIGMAGLSVFAAFYNRKNAARTGVSRLYTLLVVTFAFLFTLKEDKTHWRAAAKSSFQFPLLAGGVLERVFKR